VISDLFFTSIGLPRTDEKHIGTAIGHFYKAFALFMVESSLSDDFL